MADNVLQSFLVELGFKVDEETLGKFQKGLKTGATQAVAFGNLWSEAAKKAVGAAGDIVKGVLDMTQQLDTLYFASRRVNDTASNIAGLGYAFEQVGLSAQQAQGAMEAVQSMRTLYGPGFYRDIFGGAGLTGRESPAETITKLMTYLRGEYAKGGNAATTAEVLRRTYLSQFSQADIQQYDPVKATAAQKEYNAALAEFGLNQEQAAKNADDLETSIRSLEMRLKVMFEALISPAVTTGIKDFVDFLKEFASAANNELIPALNDILTPLKQLFDQLSLPPPKQFADQLVDKLTIMARISEAAIGMVGAGAPGPGQHLGRAAAWAAAMDILQRVRDSDNPNASDIAAATAASRAAESFPDTGTPQQGKEAVERAAAAAARAYQAGARSGGEHPVAHVPVADLTQLGGAYNVGFAYSGDRATLGHQVTAKPGEVTQWADYAYNYAKTHGLSQDAAAALAMAVAGEGGTPGAGPGTTTASGLFQLVAERQKVFESIFKDEKGRPEPWSKSKPWEQMKFTLMEMAGLTGNPSEDKYRVDLTKGTSADILKNIIDTYLRPSPGGALADWKRATAYGAHVAGGATGDMTFTQYFTITGSNADDIAGKVTGQTADVLRHIRRNARPVG